MGLRDLSIYLVTAIVALAVAARLARGLSRATRGLYYLVLIPVNAARLAATVVGHALSRAYRPIAVRLIARRHRAG